MEVSEGRSPWQQGFSACRRGETIHQNPFTAFTADHSEWQKGWQAQNEHMNNKHKALDSIGWHGATPCK